MAFVGSLVTRSGRRLRLLLTGLALLGVMVATPLSAAAATAPSLGAAQSFSVLGASTVTNTGPSVVTGDLGVSPGNSVIGFPPGLVNGAMHKTDAVALQAQNDVTTAYNSLAGQTCNVDLTGQDLGGLTLTTGVYCFSSSAQLTGALTLDAQGSANAVFIFKIGSTLTTASASSVRIINGGSPCSVFWQIGSSATLGTTTTFVGTILALASVTLTTGANINGRAVARTGAVTMDTNNISLGGCGPPASAPSQCIGNIRGRKQDGGGNGLPGWTIQLSQNGSSVQSAVTDSGGNFNFLGLNKGTYTIQEVPQGGWTATGPTSMDVTLDRCDQNATGYTFTNVSAVTTTTPSPTGVTTATPGKGTPTAHATKTPSIPRGLPNTGGIPPETLAFALVAGAVLTVVGLAKIRRDKRSRNEP